MPNSYLRTTSAGLLLAACLAASIPASGQAGDNSTRRQSPLGFSLGVFELYAPASSSGTPEDKSGAFKLIRPRFFGNTKTRNTQFQYDYTFGYRSDNRQSGSHSSDHDINLGFDYRLSRNATLHISDTFRSAFNSNGALPNSTSPMMYQPSFAQELYVPNERSTTNSVVTAVNYRAGKRTNVTVFGSVDMWRYGASSFGNAQGVQAGIRGDHQINKWLFLNSSYSHYLNAVNPRFQGASIHRLQIGGLKFKLRRNMEVYFSGGADYTRFQGIQQPAVSYQGGFSKTAGATRVSVVYHRGLSTAVGPQATLNGHVISASLTEQLSRRINFQFGSGYTRGVSPNKSTSLSYLAGNADLQIAVQRHVMFSVQSSYISQRGTNLPSQSPALSRFTITTGLQVLLPDVRNIRSR